ncbi:hypothetical protein BH23ACT9_BH23ACT9_06710 [soil metagenome]
MSQGHHEVLAERYRLAEEIGRGGMADVFSAEDTQSGQMVAVKVMRVGEAADPERFASEMQILERLSHPAIVRLFDTGRTAEDSPYFVMQLIDGESLSTRLREEGPLPHGDLLKVAARVAGALAHAHDQGVVHRDIKPANILIDERGRGYLTDFGVARLVDSALLTRTGTTIGTAAYLAPEQLQDSAVGPSADVYSLALVLIEALTGRRAFRGTGVEAALARLGSDPRIPEELSQHWRGLLVSMTRRDPERRPSAAFVEAVLRGTEPPPPLDPAEMAARAAPARAGDDDPTALTPVTGDTGSGRWAPPHTPPPTPAPPATPTPMTAIAGGEAPLASAPPAAAEGRHAGNIRSRPLLIGALLGALVVLLSLGVALTLRPVSDPVIGSDPVDDAVRELVVVLDAAETLRASHPTVARSLRTRSLDVVEAVNDDRWDAALIAVDDMAGIVRAGVENDINPVAVTGLREALRTLILQIQAEVEAQPPDAGESGG